MHTKTWDNIVKDIHSPIELEDCLDTAMERVTDLLGVGMGSLMLLDKENQELSIKTAKGLSEEVIRDARIRIGNGVSGWVAKNRKPLLIKDIEEDKRFKRREGKYHNNSLLSVPLIKKDRVLGVINVNNKNDRGVFKESDLDKLMEISEHISNAVDRALKYEEVKRLSQIKLDFVSTVSHELRSPLAAVKEAINLLLEEIPGKINERQRSFLNISRNNVDRVLNLINELLDMSKLEAGKSGMKRNFQDICDITRQVYETLKINADKKNIKLKLVMPKGAIKMWFDEAQIARALMNLIGNAVKFTQENGMVDIRLEDLGRFVKFSVIDNGPGIREEDMDRVFDKFYSVIKAGTSEVKSTGLGLPITKEIVELHRGRIWVDSQARHGARFSFTLPKDIRTVYER